MRVLYFANPESIHDAKWINGFSKSNDVAVVCGSDYSPASNCLTSAIEIKPVLPPYSVWNRKRTNTAIEAISEISADFGPDIIHSMYAVPKAVWADSVAAGNHVITTRGSDLLVDYSIEFRNPATLTQRISYPVMRKRIEAALRNAAFVTSTSYRQNEIVSRIRGNTEGTAVIRTGVDTGFFRSEIVDKTNDEFVLFCPRSIKPVYNIELLVRSFAELLRQRPAENRLKLLIIDDLPDSEYSNTVRAAIVHEKVDDHVELLPKIDQEEMRRQYQAADLVVMIPKSDGTPVSAIEAMLMKTAVVVGDLPYDEDIFNESTVWKTDIASPEKIAETLASVIANENGRRLKVEKAYKSASENAGLENSLKRINAIYESICGK